MNLSIIRKSFLGALLIAGAMIIGGALPAAAQHAPGCNDVGNTIPGCQNYAHPGAPQQPQNWHSIAPGAPRQYRQDNRQVQQQQDYRRRRDHNFFGPVIIAPPVIEDQPDYSQPDNSYYAAGQWVACSAEGGRCHVPYPTRVRYGKRGRYVFEDVDGSVPCNNRVFGDPIPGVRKSCWFLAQ